jgi:hypothetical protein
VEVELASQGKPSWSGFLEVTDKWQIGCVELRKGALMRYFVNGGAG